MANAVMEWKHYFEDYNEGLGLVYERFVLNDFLDGLRREFGIRKVLEAPLFGMAGVSGINSVVLAQNGCDVTLADDNPERIAGVKRVWDELSLPVRIVHVDDWARLPFPDDTFDLAWEWAGLWYLPDPEGLLRELARVSRKVVFVAMPNRIQIGYWMRKWVLDRDFFPTVDEKWTKIGLLRKILESEGIEIVRHGVIDVPPWPDTVMPAKDVLRKLGIKSKKLEGKFSGEGWKWSSMDYYLGKDKSLKERVLKYAWLDRARLPWWIKALWGHHRYLVGIKPGQSEA